MPIATEAGTAHRNSQAAVSRMTPAIIHAAMKPVTNSNVDRVLRLAKLRSRTCQSGTMASGSIMATTITAQLSVNDASECEIKARSNDADSGSLCQASAEQK